MKEKGENANRTRSKYKASSIPPAEQSCNAFVCLLAPQHVVIYALMFPQNNVLLNNNFVPPK
jgi:hypothetical protein